MTASILPALAARRAAEHRLSLWQLFRLGSGIAVDPPESVRRACEQHAEVAHVRMPGRSSIYLTSSAEIAQHVLKTHQANYFKSTQRNRFADLFGKGLIMHDGPEWLEDRRLMQPSFSRTSMEDLRADIDARVATQLETFGGEMHMQAAADTLALVTFCDTLLGVDVRPHVGTLTRLFSRGIHTIYERDGALVSLPSFSRRFERDRNTLWTIFDSLATSARGNGTLLDTMVRHADQRSDGQAWLRDQMMSLLVAGHETVAATFVWALLLLAAHPRAQTELRERLQAGDDTYLRAVLHETMRLYPAVWCVGGRRAREDDDVFGLTVEKDALVVVCLYAMHRNARLWPQPDAFLPERFLPPNAHKVPHYLPFGAGARTCIGEHFSMHILLSALSRLILAHRIAPISRDAITALGHDAHLTLRPKRDPLLRLEPCA